MLPSHNCINNHNVQFSRCILNSLKKFNETMNFRSLLQSTSLREVVGQNGLEPSTSRLSVVCSSQLSYWPISSKSNPQSAHLTQALNAPCVFVSPLRIKPASLGFASVPHPFWWRVPGSNRWPPACKAGALPAELTPHIQGFLIS